MKKVNVWIFWSDYHPECYAMLSTVEPQIEKKPLGTMYIDVSGMVPQVINDSIAKFYGVNPGQCKHFELLEISK